MIIHIAGYPGTGKTTFLKQLKTNHEKIYLDYQHKKHMKLFLKGKSKNYNVFSKTNVKKWETSYAKFLRNITDDEKQDYIMEGTFSIYYNPKIHIDHKFYLTVPRKVLYERTQKRHESYCQDKYNKQKHQKSFERSEIYHKNLGYKLINADKLTKRIANLTSF